MARLWCVLGPLALWPALTRNHVYWPLTLGSLLLWALIFNAALTTAYYRGGQIALDELRNSDEAHMNVNSRIVAFEDLVRLTEEYNIPPEKVLPIVERGIGIHIEKIQDQD